MWTGEIRMFQFYHKSGSEAQAVEVAESVVPD